LRRFITTESRADFIEGSRLCVRRRTGQQLDFQQTRMIACELFNVNGQNARAQQNDAPAGFGITHQRREHALGVRRDASMLRGGIAQPKSDPRNPVSGI
jgi:hypothetical protein